MERRVGGREWCRAFCSVRPELAQARKLKAPCLILTGEAERLQMEAQAAGEEEVARRVKGREWRE